MVQSFRLTLRPLLRDPWFASWVTISLALSLAAVASVFSIADRLLLRPPAGISDATHLGRVSALSIDQASASSFDQPAFSYPAYEAAKQRAGKRVELTAFTEPSSGEFLFGGAGGTARLSFASGNYFRVLGVRPSAGTLLADSDDQPSASPVGVLSEAFARRFSPNPRSLVGRAIRLDGRSYTVIGIAGGGFSGTELSATEIWVPLRTAGKNAFGDDWTTNPAIYPLTVLGRRASGVNDGIVNQVVLAGLAAEPPAAGKSIRYVSARFDPLLAARGPNPSRQAMLVLWLSVTALAVLLVAGINTGTLYLARGRRQARNLAVRMALGATRGRIIRSLVLEALILTTLGAVFGLIAAVWTSDMLRALVLPTVGWNGRLVDFRVAGATGLLALAVAVGTSVLPALRSTAFDPATCVRDAPAAFQGGGRTWRFLLHAIQAAFCAALLVATGLFLRSSLVAQRLDLGFNPHSLYAVTEEHAPGAATSAAVSQAVTQLGERVKAARGISSVSVASTAPMVSSSVQLVYAEGAPGDVAGMLEGPHVTVADREYLRVTGTRLVRGRGLEAAEESGGALINRSAAARLWPGRDPLGRCLHIGAEDAACVPVVGITEDAVRRAITDPPAFQVYLPLSRQPGQGRVLLLRTSDERVDVNSILRPILQEAFPPSITPHVRSIENLTSSQSALWRSGASLFTALGVLMILLAGLGLYGSLAYLASSRSYEFGVRIAFGAPPRRIALTFVRFGLLVTTTGFFAGLGILRLFQSWLQPLLFETDVFDASVIGGAFLIVAIVSLLATARPAVTAARTNPMRLLRGGRG